jgi:hypothetical protein
MSPGPVDDAETTTGSTDEEDPQSEEANKVSRMIRFVQEPNLSSIAGEWVLARFSGVPGAKWFLCHLELGSTHNFYGHRIPTDEIDFHDASPEVGLVRYWEVYMMRKKRKLCGVLEALLESKDMGNVTADVAEALGELASRDAGEDGESDGEDEKLVGSPNGKKYIDDKLERGALAAMKAGAGLFQTFWELRADQLERNLSASVLKRIPRHLQVALENLNDNKDLMPAMFHSAERVHMF